MAPAAADLADPARWSYASPTDPGSRAYGLHWAAVWLEGRALGEEADGDLFTAVRPLLADKIAATTRRARVERALGRDGQPTALDRRCPYCRGPLTAYTRAAPVMVRRSGRSSRCPWPASYPEMPTARQPWPSRSGRRRRQLDGGPDVGVGEHAKGPGAFAPRP
ncbi:hypothetical protein [Streptomyces sp. NBC_00887]|uniref:hypothetical protein n=1 Tax=Streptomyces sp. NBC_00887 TaxID=2975859 RepID=UPI00386A2A5D|nr:hypothetical protein OG844_04605 [Streptomyces sp. NBC_00887]WSY35634.1 hypothetical protein OG844_40995 [Streptomyces sp. NBC_00887]